MDRLAMTDSSRKDEGRELAALIERQKRELQASIAEAKRLIEHSHQLLARINEQERRGNKDAG
jgi:hypothetical protein